MRGKCCEEPTTIVSAHVAKQRWTDYAKVAASDLCQRPTRMLEEFAVMLNCRHRRCDMTVPSVSSSPPTGEPDAGDLHVRFGWRGSLNRLSLPL